MFDYLVIGKGLFGASAARHLCQVSNNVAIIGPDEPQDPAAHLGVYGAHYDEARLLHYLSESQIWAELTQRTLDQLPSLEATQQAPFHHPVGTLYVVDEAMSPDYIETATEIATQFAVEYQQVDATTLSTYFPYLTVPAKSQIIWETAPSGYFNPRTFLQAQVTLAQNQGAQIIREIATRVRDKGDWLEVITDQGATYATRKLLIAAGAFSNSFDLLQRNVDLRLKIEYVIMAGVSSEEAARLHTMPTLIHDIDSPNLGDIYVVPPVRYPDGNYYLKLGANTPADHYVETLDQICDWYRDGNSDVMLANLQNALLTLIPDLQATSWHTRRCVITRTVHGFPYIDIVTPGKVYVAIGGNGRSAQAADAIGHLAAKLVSEDSWQDSINSHLFQIRYADEALLWAPRAWL
ncbi:MAG: FAD-binding oxidoreductase [Chloroflexota bacterium]